MMTLRWHQHGGRLAALAPECFGAWVQSDDQLKRESEDFSVSRVLRHAQGLQRSLPVSSSFGESLRDMGNIPCRHRPNLKARI
jgi:hypothetical protein